MTRRFAALTLMAAVLAVLPPTLSARADKLTFGNEGTYPPFSVLDPSGKLTGFEPELARAMCQRMNAECDIVAMDFKALIPSMMQGKLDAIVSQITPTPSRVGKMLFSMVIIQNDYSFVVPIDSHYTFTKEGLKGVKMGLVSGGATSKFIMDEFGDSIVPVWYDNMVQVKLELLNGRVAASFGARINWRLDLIETPDGKGWKLDDKQYWLGDPNLPENERGLSWVTRLGNEALIERMNKALASLIADCSYTKLREQYIKFSILPAEAHCLKPSG
jgi:arginine/ornithine transport system substrate-binding protein